LPHAHSHFHDHAHAHASSIGHQGVHFGRDQRLKSGFHVFWPIVESKSDVTEISSNWHVHVHIQLHAVVRSSRGTPIVPLHVQLVKVPFWLDGSLRSSLLSLLDSQLRSNRMSVLKRSIQLGSDSLSVAAVLRQIASIRLTI
jgi:hypothetical protein